MPEVKQTVNVDRVLHRISTEGLGSPRDEEFYSAIDIVATRIGTLNFPDRDERKTKFLRRFAKAVNERGIKGDSDARRIVRVAEKMGVYPTSKFIPPEFHALISDRVVICTVASDSGTPILHRHVPKLAEYADLRERFTILSGGLIEEARGLSSTERVKKLYQWSKTIPQFSEYIQFECSEFLAGRGLSATNLGVLIDINDDPSFSTDPLLGRLISEKISLALSPLVTRETSPAKARDTILRAIHLSSHLSVNLHIAKPKTVAKDPNLLEKLFTTLAEEKSTTIRDLFLLSATFISSKSRLGIPYPRVNQNLRQRIITLVRDGTPEELVRDLALHLRLCSPKLRRSLSKDASIVSAVEARASLLSKQFIGTHEKLFSSLANDSLLAAWEKNTPGYTHVESLFTLYKTLLVLCACFGGLKCFESIEERMSAALGCTVSLLRPGVDFENGASSDTPLDPRSLYLAEGSRSPAQIRTLLRHGFSKCLENRIYTLRFIENHFEECIGLQNLETSSVMRDVVNSAKKALQRVVRAKSPVKKKLMWIQAALIIRSYHEVIHPEFILLTTLKTLRGAIPIINKPD